MSAQELKSLLHRRESSPRTTGNFSTHKAAEAFFDKMLGSEFFRIEKEVMGRRLFDDKPVWGGNGQIMRLDRILHPTEKARNIGWKYGAIGVEIKKTGEKIGGVFTQVLEQRQGLYQSNELRGTRILPTVFAIFPSENPGGVIHSLAISQVILFCFPMDDSIIFTDGNYKIISISEDHFYVNPKWSPSTRKGHRG